MEDPDITPYLETKALLTRLYRTELIDSFEQDFGTGGLAFITNGRLYQVGFNLTDTPPAFTLSAGAPMPFMEASPEIIEEFKREMLRRFPLAHYRARGPFGFPFGAHVEGVLPDLRQLEPEFLRCKQLLDECLDSQSRVAFDL